MRGLWWWLALAFAKILFDGRLAFVGRPVRGRSVPEDVFEVEAGAVLDEETDDGFVACSGGVMEEGAVGVAAGGVVAVGVFAGFEEGPDDFRVAELGGDCEGEVAVFG